MEEAFGSVVSPTWQEVGKLGAIAVIRTFLNYFLEKDLDSAEASGEGAGQTRVRAWWKTF